MIEVETFDELFGDILSLLPDASPDILHLLDSRSARVSDSPVPAPGRSWPVIRFNAFPITSAPTMCRRVVCEIGGYKEMREAIDRAGVQVIAGRRNIGIIAFGEDTDLQKAFGPHHISDFPYTPLTKGGCDMNLRNWVFFTTHCATRSAGAAP